MKEQLALSLPARTDYSAASFVEGDANAAARSALAGWRNWPDRRMALIGPPGAGKSHMAAIWSRDSSGRVLPAMELADALSGLPDGQSLVIEDADRGVDEAALFHAINRAAEGSISALLLTGRTPPALWRSQLPDLASRLRATAHADLAEPDDALLRRVMEKQFADRQAPVSDGVVDYLLPRMERSVAAARSLVEALDRRALAKRTPVTRAVAREVLEKWDETEEDETR